MSYNNSNCNKNLVGKNKVLSYTCKECNFENFLPFTKLPNPGATTFHKCLNCGKSYNLDWPN